MKRMYFIGLSAALLMLVFQVLRLCAQFHYLKMEYYIGLVAISFGIIGYFVKGRETDKKASTPNLLLSHKELQVFDMILAGKSNKEIACAHFIEISTVKTHVNHIYSKLAVQNRHQLRYKYLKVDLPDQK